MVRRNSTIAAILVALSILASGFLLIDSVVGLLRTQSELSTQFSGAALADVFGFGLWPTILIVTAVQIPLFVGISFLSRSRAALAIAIAIFLISSATFYFDHVRTEALWMSHDAA